MIVSAFTYRRMLDWVSSPERAPMLCYGAGLVATRLTGEGPAGQPLLGLAAPLAMGVMIRNGRSTGSA